MIDHIFGWFNTDQQIRIAGLIMDKLADFQIIVTVFDEFIFGTLYQMKTGHWQFLQISDFNMRRWSNY